MKRKFNESEDMLEPETPYDFIDGNEDEDNEDDEQSDVIDEALWSLMDELIAGGNSEKDAEKLVKEMVERLVKEEQIYDMPEYESDDGTKAMWINTAIPKIRFYLRQNGEII